MNKYFIYNSYICSVFKRLAYVLICISILIIQSHDVFIHHHDLPYGHENATHHDDKTHNVFSSIDIDEEFTLHSKINLTIGFVATLSLNTAGITLYEPTLISSLVEKNEYPPPKQKLSFKSLRAPPVNFFC